VQGRVAVFVAGMMSRLVSDLDRLFFPQKIGEQNIYTNYMFRQIRVMDIYKHL